MTTPDLPTTAAHLVATVAPSVVTIGRDRRGSGFVVAQDRVLTNAHNLRDRTTSVTFADGTSAQGRVTAADLDGDLAVLEVPTGDRPPLAGRDEPVVLGATVLTVTLAGPTTPRVTTGHVSVVERSFRGPRGRRITGGVEHTAPLVRGASGGPLLDADGALLGVNTHRLRGGLYLAQPWTTDLAERVAGLGRGEVPTVAHLGVALAPGHVADELRAAVGLAPATGLLVREVMPDGAAARAGLEQGDLLTSLDGVALDHPGVLHARLTDVVVREDEDAPTLELGVLRGEAERTVVVTFTADDVRPRAAVADDAADRHRGRGPRGRGPRGGGRR